LTTPRCLVGNAFQDAVVQNIVGEGVLLLDEGASPDVRTATVTENFRVGGRKHILTHEWIKLEP
jgi:hypothetical protein